MTEAHTEGFTTPNDGADPPPEAPEGVLSAEQESPESEGAESEEAEGEAPEAPEGDDGEAGDEEGAEEADEEQPDDTDEDEFEEVEWEGRKYSIPKDLKPHLMMQADYTRKTQEVAEERRKVEAWQQEVAQQAKVQQALVEDYGRLQVYDAQLAQYENVDWAKLEQDDPVAAQSHFRAYQQIKDARSRQAAEIESKQHERTLAEQQHVAKRIEEGRRVLAREIKGWGPDVAAKVAEYGRSQGFTDQELGSVDDPRLVKTLHRAMLYDQHLSKARQAAKARPNKAEVKPAAKVAPRRAPATTGLSDDLPMDEWERRFLKKRARSMS